MSEVKHETRAVFAGALVLTTPEERARYLDDACRGKPELRQRVEALLRAHEEAGVFLEEPAGPLAGKTIALAMPLTEKPGDKIGPYKLLQQIGEGGCEVVYMAEQAEPIRPNPRRRSARWKRRSGRRWPSIGRRSRPRCVG